MIARPTGATTSDSVIGTTEAWTDARVEPNSRFYASPSKEFGHPECASKKNFWEFFACPYLSFSNEI
jgi:hypothetical protein